VAPFTRAARIGFAALAAVTVIALGLTTFLATRLATPVARLADAADSVAAGRLDHRVEGGGPAELRRLGTSFNVMTNSLRATLNELSRRSALAAVGEFATSLSHEVRNALTSIKVDLQRAARRAPDDAASRELVARALNNVSRLETTVTGSLRVARGDRATREALDLRAVLARASEAVAGAYSAVPATLSCEVGDEPRTVVGDRSALEQLFANILFNAGQAVRPGGHVTLRIEANNGTLVTTIADDGVGMTATQLEHVSNAEYSSKPTGSGLGLPIARQIAAAHQGSISIESTPDAGTTVRVELPAAGSLVGAVGTR
jgi:signal transduction histidine kinase